MFQYTNYPHLIYHILSLNINTLKMSCAVRQLTILSR